MSRNPKFASIGLVEIGEELAHLRKSKPQQKRRGLVNRWFHSFNEDGQVEWQGTVLEEIGEGIFLVQLFDWILGQDCNQQIVKLEDMLGWNFYDTSEDMDYAWHHIYRHRGEKV